LVWLKLSVQRPLWDRAHSEIDAPQLALVSGAIVKLKSVGFDANHTEGISENRLDGVRAGDTNLTATRETEASEEKNGRGRIEKN
jgi:hypothetical protein